MSGRWRGCARELGATRHRARGWAGRAEDHAAILCEIMAGLASGRSRAVTGRARALFEEHLAPWMERFFCDLEQAECAGALPPNRTPGGC
jgi:TorA maturation chaperone TorD